MHLGFGGLIAPRVRRELWKGIERLHILPRRNWKVAGTALLALLFATVKEWKPIMEFLKDPSDPFSDAFMLLIVGGWIVWPVAVAGEFFGSEIVSVERGELIVRRGIGRVRRTFRYLVKDIAWMERDGPITEEQSKPVVHHIYRKPQAGAVRFNYGREVVFLGDTLDEETGETIVRWLRPKLPRTASNSDFW